MDKFFVKEIYIRNRAPFEEIHLRFNKDDIYLIAGVNGKGKTTLLSHIVKVLCECLCESNDFVVPYEALRRHLGDIATYFADTS